MRTASVCPTCAKYENALCVLYDGDYLSALDIAPGDTLEDIIIKINAALAPFVTTTSSTSSTTSSTTSTTTTETPTTTTTTTNLN